MPDYADDLDLGRRLADHADEISIEYFLKADQLPTELKADRTPVTAADRDVEQMVRGVLAAERPGDAVSGEEFGTTGASLRRWVIDPIDGTKNFIRGVPVWATLIALLDGDVPVVGVVSAPALGRRWWAARGERAWGQWHAMQPRELRVSRVARLSEASISYSSLSGWPDVDRFVGMVNGMQRSRAFGDFWSYMLVAEGAVDIAAEPELSLWDMAALAPIVTEAGGRFTSLDGTDGVLGGNAAASNRLLHEEFLAALH